MPTGGVAAELNRAAFLLEDADGMRDDVSFEALAFEQLTELGSQPCHTRGGLDPAKPTAEALPAGHPFDEEVDTDRHVVVLRKALRATLATRVQGPWVSLGPLGCMRRGVLNCIIACGFIYCN